MQALDLNLRHLRALVATSKCGSISAAAAQVNLSQPAVTQAIAKLEELTATRLFERRPTGMTATDGGVLLTARAEAAGAALAQGFQGIRKPGMGGFAGADKLMTMTQLRALLALAAAGSYVGAAADTGLSQPSLHRAVRDLERLCGVPLVDRRGRGVRLTEAGTRLTRAFRLAASELNSALDELAVLAGRDSGTIRIGAMPLARARLIPLATARFHAKHPPVTIEISEGSHAELIDRLRDGQLDFLVGALRFPNPGPDVEQEPLFEDRLIAVARKDHPLSTMDRPSPARLAMYPWVLARPGTPLHKQWERMFLDAGLIPPPAPVICGSVMAIRTLLIESDFLTLLSPEQVRLELASGVLAAIGKPLESTRREIGLTTRAGWHPTPAQAALFLDELNACIAELALPENQ